MFFLNKNLTYKIQLKVKFAAAIISRCAADRSELVTKLREYIQVDVYGKCGELSCPDDNKTDCNAHIAAQYKFFFAFENSLCSEYITEKFFRTLNYDIVPVVLGLGDYSKYVPKSGYINVLDYKSPKELADYLIYLDKNPSEYNKYFAWRKHISYHHDRWSTELEMSVSHTTTFHTFCEMCIKLNMEIHFGVQQRDVNNIEELYDVSNCKRLKLDEAANHSFVIKNMKRSKNYCQTPKKGIRLKDLKLNESEYRRLSNNKAELAKYIEQLRVKNMPFKKIGKPTKRNTSSV